MDKYAVNSSGGAWIQHAYWHGRGRFKANHRRIHEGKAHRYEAPAGPNMHGFAPVARIKDAGRNVRKLRTARYYVSIAASLPAT